MEYIANKFQLEQLFARIHREYRVFGPQKVGRKLLLEEIDRFSQISFPVRKTKNTFKNIFFPINLNDQNRMGKIAFWGLPLCDAYALEIFLKEFSGKELVPERRDVLIVAAQCCPDEYCACQSFSIGASQPFDLYLQKEKDSFIIFTAKEMANKLLKETEFKQVGKKYQIEPVDLGKKPLDKKELSKAVGDKVLFEEYWQRIANNCFGCSSCSAVCPLCFCFHQKCQNQPDGSAKVSLESDSCFKRSFSEIQHQFSLREKNMDRLYNWYHHKFVRHFEKNTEILCTGCGRCIEACPAHLNQLNIVSSLIKEEEKNG